MGRSRIQALIRSSTEIGSPPAIPEVKIHLADALTPLWQAVERMQHGLAPPPPYWAFAWAGGQALARHILDSPWLVRGRRVLDFMAGSGIAGIAAGIARAARVEATDPDPLASQAIVLNAEANNVVVMMRTDDVTQAPVGAWEVILASDVLYEPETAEKYIPWLRQRSSEGAMIMMADPGCAFHADKRFVRIADYKVPVVREGEVMHMPTNIYRLAGTERQANE